MRLLSHDDLFRYFPMNHHAINGVCLDPWARLVTAVTGAASLMPGWFE